MPVPVLAPTPKFYSLISFERKIMNGRGCRLFSAFFIVAMVTFIIIKLETPWTDWPGNVGPGPDSSLLGNVSLSGNVSSLRIFDARGKCSSSWCQLPDCRCAGSDIPGGLSRDHVPMMVMLTFDDGVNTVNYPLYEEIFDGSLRNPNGCPVKGTFFVSGDYTDYKLVKRLSKSGHEIASHTLSHRYPTTWWSHASVTSWEKEVMGMKNRLAEKSNIPHDSIQGMRAPFLQIGGNDQYTMLVDNNFRYDSSMVAGSRYKNSKPPIWPFTLNSPPNHQTCNLHPCPTESYPGLWEIPLIRWYDNNGKACTMADSCYTDHGHQGTFSLLQENFQRHNKSNRAPFGIFIHATWFQKKSENFEALKDFLSSILGKKDVWLLTASQVLDWVEKPIPSRSLDSIKSWQC